MRHVRRLLLLATPMLALPSAPWAQPAPLRDFDAYVAQAMKDWEVPGVALAVVKDDSLVLLRGYGVRQLGKPEPVDGQTMFGIASVTKSFTAALVAMLVDEKKLGWDDPVSRHLLGFELADPYVTRELTVRDLLTHRSGLARGDMLWYASPFSRQEILRRVRFLRPAWSLRSRYGYQNIMYIAAGEIVAAAAGKSWDEVVRERIFAPLGMTATNTSVKDLAGLPNVAAPHQKIGDTVRAIPYRNVDNVGSAGSINSNAAEMARWVRFQLGEGKWQGKQLIGPAAFREMHTPQTVIRIDSATKAMNPDVHLMAYGMGWNIHDYRGREVWRHAGNLDGMSALVAALPEERLGVVVLSNMNFSDLRTALMYRIIDAYLQAPPKDWSTLMLAAAKRRQQQARANEQRQDSTRVRGTKPSFPLERYVGTYVDSMYGEARVWQESGKLVLGLGPAFAGDLEHWHFDTFRARWRDRSLGTQMVTFTMNASARIEAMKLDDLADFQRLPERRDSTAVRAGAPR